MKKLLIFIGFGILPLLLSSQISQEFNYQAVVRNTEGVIQKGSIVNFTIDILQNGIPVYCEEHNNLNTGQLGVVNFKVGAGTTGNCGFFSDIQWSQGQLQIRVTLNGEEMNLADIVAVPFALYAQNAGNSYWVKQDTNIYYSEGKVGVGINLPESDLHVIDSDISLTGGGGILIGNLDGNNLAIDQNEIMARENGGIARLNLQAEGGEIRVHSTEPESTQFVINNDGKVGIGTSVPKSDLHVIDSDISLTGGGGVLIGNLNGANLAIDQNEIMARENGSIARLNLQADGGEIRVHSTEPESTQFVINNDGKVGIGIKDPLQPLHIRRSNADAQVRLERVGNNAGYSTIGGSSRGFIVGHFNNDGTYIRDFIVDHNGMAEVNCLKIKGGCDIKEDFDSVEKLEPGDVVILDAENPGQLIKSLEPYDKKVAGVISGANGVSPGLTLSQSDRPSGEFPLAMVGQVYVKAIGKVEVGDMMTTSNVPGLAMAVDDHSQALGAVIGKAMSAQDNGSGFVLLLVNLQ